jgi:hypothetical protein
VPWTSTTDRLEPCGLLSLPCRSALFRQAKIPQYYSTTPNPPHQLQQQAVSLSVIPTQIARRIPSPKMDVAVLRGRIVATLDADADARRRAELDLKTVSRAVEPSGPPVDDIFVG